MTEEAKRKRSEYARNYQREWRKKNPGKQKEYQERYWEKKAREQQA